MSGLRAVREARTTGAAASSGPTPADGISAAPAPAPAAAAIGLGSTSIGVLGLLGALYAGQMIGIGFLTAMGTMLRSRGVGLEELALVQSVGVVWGLKLLWAPLIDRVRFGRFGHLRPWLLALQAAMVVAVLAMGLVRRPEDGIGTLALLALGFALLSATQDIATDALAARTTASGRRGIVNGIQQAGGYLGTLLGGGLTVLVFDELGWQAAIVTVALTIALPIAATLAYREGPAVAPPPSMRSSYGAIRTVLARPGAALWSLAAMPLVLVGANSVAYAVMGPALVDAGIAPSAVALTTTVLAAPVAMGVALAAGWAIGRVGCLRVAVLGCILTAAALLAMLPVVGGGVPAPVALAVYGAYIAIQTIPGTVLYTVSMDYCRTESAGSDVTTIMAFPTIVSMGAAAGGLALAGSVGYGGVVMLAVVLTVVGGALVALHIARHGRALEAMADAAADRAPRA